jgi:hypothetical protein
MEHGKDTLGPRMAKSKAKASGRVKSFGLGLFGHLWVVDSLCVNLHKHELNTGHGREA